MATARSLDPIVVRRAVSAAQTLLQEHDGTLGVDGKAGSRTMKSYNAAPPALRNAVDSVTVALSGAKLPAMFEEYKEAKARALSTNDGRALFDLQVVPALIREARKVGMNPHFAIAQAALESGWGESVPKRTNGESSHNYGGIKWESDRTSEKSLKTSTLEDLKKTGKAVRTTDYFAVYDSPAEFARRYAWYLTGSGSAYRYKGLLSAKTPEEAGAILQNGGYATDQKYGEKFAAVVRTAMRKYPELA